MKKLFGLYMCFTLIVLLVNAQVGINSDNSQPDPSAGLDVKFNNKGVLLPRMSFDERNAIANPTEGLMVYCTNCGRLGSLGSLSIFTNGAWMVIGPCTINPVTVATHTVTPGQIIWRWTGTTSGVKWSTLNNFDNAVDLGLVSSKTETGISCGQTYTRYVWNYSTCGVAGVTTLILTTDPANPDPPVAGTQVPSMFQVIWNWNAVPTATGYKWSANNDFSTATDMATSLTKTETGLICNTLYTRYVWAYNSCGVSAVTIITASTNPPPNAPVEGTHTSSCTQIVWNWFSVPNALGYKWNTVDDYSTATNMSTTLQKTETGLLPSTSYTRYVWAYNNACVSPVTTITSSTLPVPATPTAGTHTSTMSQITWNWNPAAGATGYKWNTVNNYSTAINLGTSTSITETGLNCGTQYTKYLWAYNACGGSSLASILTQATLPCSECIPFTDVRDQKTYTTILIGGQCWLGQNINIGTRINGSQDQANNQVIEKYCYNDLESNCDIYGGFYQWNEAMQYVTTTGTQGICPIGWHLPTDPEWTVLTTFLGGESVAGGQMKETGTVHWTSPNTGATNSSGFTGLGSGYRNLQASFNAFTMYTWFWSSSSQYYRQLDYSSASVGRSTNPASNGFSVRCLKD